MSRCRLTSRYRCRSRATSRCRLTSRYRYRSRATSKCRSMSRYRWRIPLGCWWTCRAGRRPGPGARQYARADGQSGAAAHARPTAHASAYDGVATLGRAGGQPDVGVATSGRAGRQRADGDATRGRSGCQPDVGDAALGRAGRQPDVGDAASGAGRHQPDVGAGERPDARANVPFRGPASVSGPGQ